MVAYLSDKLGGLTFTPKPQSPYRAGTLVHALTDDVSAFTANGFLEADGSAISRTDYADAFAIMGTKYGVGDGSTTFNLPNGPRRTVEIELEITRDGGSAWTEYIQQGYCYQDTSGQWWLHWEIGGTTPTPQGAVTLSPSGCTFEFNGNTRVGVAGTIGGAGLVKSYVSSATEITIDPESVNGTVWGTSGDVRLTGKPTDSFVNQDSRFSTFDEALESIPMVKMYNDASNISMSIKDATPTENGTVRLSDAFAATPTQYGLTQQSDWQQRILSSPLSSNTTNVSDLRLENLVVDQVYEIEISMRASVSGSSTAETATLDAVHDGSTILSTRVRDDQAVDVTENTYGNSITFVASDTFVQVNATFQGTGSISADLTWILIKERKDLSPTPTTKFTP